jgi:hypothetical protein
MQSSKHPKTEGLTLKRVLLFLCVAKSSGYTIRGLFAIVAQLKRIHGQGA